MEPMVKARLYRARTGVWSATAYREEAQVLVDQSNKQEEIIEKLSTQLGRIRRKAERSTEVKELLENGYNAQHEEVEALELNLRVETRCASAYLRADLEAWRNNAVLAEKYEADYSLRVALQASNECMEAQCFDLRRQLAEATDEIQAVRLQEQEWQEACRSQLYGEARTYRQLSERRTSGGTSYDYNHAPQSTMHRYQIVTRIPKVVPPRICNGYGDTLRTSHESLARQHAERRRELASV